MSKYIYSFILLLISSSLVAQKGNPPVPLIDNLGYWQSMVAKGLAKPNPVITPPPAVYKGSKINSPLVSLTNSVDIVIDNTSGVTQSENSVFINPLDKLKALNSNNSVSLTNVVFGASSFTTSNQASSWQGTTNGAGGDNDGDPAAAISNNGRYYIGYLYPNFKLGVAVSTDEGTNWTRYTIHEYSSTPPLNFYCDKDHLTVDKSITSPFQNNLYAAWYNIGWPQYNHHVGFSRSTNGGVTWNEPIGISGNQVNQDAHQGVNLHCGPNGEVFATWAVYPSENLGDETAIGFSSSVNGGISFTAPTTIANNIRGTRLTGVGKNNIGTNSYPSMAVDNSFGPNRGTIYVVWDNIGIPGINTGNDVDIYMIKSIDGGISWSTPQKVNTSSPGNSKKHFHPWITCDQTTGKIHVIYYDDRNVSSSDCETWMSSSFDGGTSWDEYKISDVSFTPIPFGPRVGYFGDYLGVTADDDVIYPMWTDNRSGRALAYTSPLISSDFCSVNLTLQNINQPLVATYKYRAQNTITVAGGNSSFIMQGNGTIGARASMIAGNSITLLPGTTIERGATLTIVPGICSSPILRKDVVSGEFSKLNIQPQEFEINSKINIYPNPVSNVMYMELSKELQNKVNVSYVISSLTGAAITKGLVTKNLSLVNTSKLISGGYFISFYEDEKLIETKKFIKN
jgi:hypothetical protein